MFTRKFWKDAAERAVSTAAQVGILAWGGGAVPDVSLPWWTIPVAMVGGAALSLLKSLGARKVGDSESASLVTQ